jgi:hypothetical protein
MKTLFLLDNSFLAFVTLIPTYDLSENVMTKALILKSTQTALHQLANDATIEISGVHFYLSLILSR